MVDGKILVEKLIIYAKKFLYLNEIDEIYTRNLLLGEFNLTSPNVDCKIDKSEIENLTVPDLLVQEIIDFAKENNLCEDGYEDVYSTKILGLLTPKPSEVNRMALSLREKISAKASCEYLYNMGIMNNYIRKTSIDKNEKWEYKDGDRILEITINLSKPEKDNKDIAKLANAPKDTTKYPMCLLCKENEGYKGTLTHPARTNLRTISLELAGEKWQMQYSPYAYFDQHCILFSANHTPMKMDKNTVEKLLDFIEFAPHYFIGSNSDLPIVGGSILNHEHYQGGLHQLPMHKAKISKFFKNASYPDVEIGQVNWYNTAIRLSSYNRNSLTELTGEIIDKWKVYSDDLVGVIANTNGVRHNTCTTIARFLPDNRYSVDIILRNNRTNERYPDGIFHAHPQYHNIKKEGIGLIEAMGLYILPARLKRQIGEIVDVLVKKSYNATEFSKVDHPLYVHRDMIAKLTSEYPNLRDENKAREVVINYINQVCVEILKNTAVFKQDATGLSALNEFLASVNIK